MFLSADRFKLVMSSTPLVTIDFICMNEKKEILLGKRVNKPAKDFYFTPGGRIFKNESMKKAVERLSLGEIGQKISMTELTLNGIYDHFYSDSIFDDVSSHFINIAYKYNMNTTDKNSNALPTEQHLDYRFFSLQDIHRREDIHHYVKDYFNLN